LVILGIKGHEGNISVEMCSDEIFLRHALREFINCFMALELGI